jgi:integrase
MIDELHPSAPPAPTQVEPALTPDNTHLSRPKTEPAEVDPAVAFCQEDDLLPDVPRAIDCITLSDLVEAFVQAGIAPATRRAYRSDLDHFLAWGGTIPASDAAVAAYLAAHADQLKVATLNRRLAAISVAHEAQGHSSPVRSPLVRATMRGIRRERGVAQRQARPLLRKDLFAVLAAMGDSLKDARDRALLLVGFAGGFRRSELCAIDCSDLERVRQGLIITLRRSKTDQESEGRKIGVPFGRTKFCPVLALDRWRDRARISEGPIFRRLDKHQRVFADALSPEAVCLIVRERVAAAGYDPEPYSGHSLRAGLATSAAQAGVDTRKIRDQTGHASDAMLLRYVRDGELFTENAAGALL